MKRPEDQIHAAVADMLRLGAPEGLLWFHVPNGGRMDTRRGWWLNRLGQRAGASDFMLIYRGRLLCLEIKSKTGRQSPEQRDFERDAVAAGATYAIARSSAEARQILAKWGCILKLEIAA